MRKKNNCDEAYRFAVTLASSIDILSKIISSDEKSEQYKLAIAQF